MIYVASPYKHEVPETRQQRYEAALAYTAKLFQQNLIAYSPIVHCHPIAVVHGLPTGWKFWGKFDEEMVLKSNLVHVLQIPGWEESIGVANEIRIAREHGIPVVYVNPYT